MRSLFSLLFFTVSLFSCDADFQLCKQKFIDVHALDGNELRIPVTKTTDLLYAPVAPSNGILKANPLMGLYLVKREEPFEHPYIITPSQPQRVAAVDNFMALPGRMVRNQSGLNHFAQFDQPLSAPCVLNDPCCTLEGIVTHYGIIDKSYLRHFIATDPFVYGDIGIRLMEREGKVYVKNIDPFMNELPFRQGDRLVAFDGKRVSDMKSLEKKILFSNQGETYTAEVKRDGKLLKVTGRVYKRYGGGFVSDTYLERYGIFFDRDLAIAEANGDLRSGDRLIRVNSRVVASADDVRQYMAAGDGSAVLLFERDGFQFFVRRSFR
jgi:hypothetical protein